LLFIFIRVMVGGAASAVLQIPTTFN